MAVVAKGIRKLEEAILNPLITGPFLYVLTRGPASIQEPLVRQLSTLLSEENIGRLVTGLKWAIALGLVRRLNRWLNSVALNNWQIKSSKAKWVWDWEIAVVTGGSSGIGAETTKALMRKGVKVAVLDIQPLPKDMEGYSNIKYFQCDVTSLESIKEAANAVRDKWGHPSILVNNAGIGKPGSILDQSDQFTEKLFKINIVSHFTLIREFMPEMVKKNKGHIVGIASMASFVSPPGIVDYAATKSAVMALHEGLNQEIKHIYRTPGVLNTVVHPSWVRTNLVSGFESHLEKTQGGLMKPEHIAKKIVDQIISCRGGQLIIPRHLATAAGLRGMSNWLQELIRDKAVGGAAAQFPGFKKAS